MICLGVGTFLYKKSTQEIGPTHTAFFYYFFSVIIAGVVWCLIKDKAPIAKETLLWPALMAAALYCSVLAFSFAVQTLEVSVASTIRSLSFLVTLALAVFFYREQLTARDFIAVLCALAAMCAAGALLAVRLPPVAAD